MSNNGARPKEKSKNNGNLKSQNKETDSSTEHDSIGISRHLSVRLNDALDRVGASAELRKCRQDCVISREIIGTIFFKLLPPTPFGTFSQFIFGSSSEGTTTQGLNSDTDYLNCPDVPVVDNLIKAGGGHSLIMKHDAYTQPGYVKLQRVYNEQPQTIYLRSIDPVTEEYDSEGRICKKHQSILGKDKHIDARNGPADTNTECNIDNVFGYRCSTIPEFAREWTERDRQYKWPSKHMLDKMAKLGCFVVGVGHPGSKERNIEWRLSFSLQERELMFSMNIVQHKCCIVLKMIKKDLLEPKVGKSLSSYHLKTCIFYVIENTRLSFWKRENLTQCVMVCLYVLFKWVYKGYCPNYFINEENMLDRDIHRAHRFALLQYMYCLLSNGCGFLFHIKLDQVGEILKNGAKSVQTDLKLTKGRFEEKIKVINAAMLFRLMLYYQANKHDNSIYFMSIILKYVFETKSLIGYNEQQTEAALLYILPFIHLPLAQSYASLAFNANTTETQCVLLNECGYHLREGRHCDISSSKLLKATVFLKLEQYGRCIGILNQLERVLNKMPLSICKCSDRRHIYSNEQEKHLYNFPVSEILRQTSTCIIFMRSDMSIMPEALQYEMFRSINTTPESRDETDDEWFDLAVVDAVVYLYFLQYLAHAKMNKLIHKHVAIDKIESVLTCEKYLGHRETGYNLLGWIHFHENWIPRGFKYLQKSWLVRPYHNAAKLHLLKWIIDRHHRQ